MVDAVTRLLIAARQRASRADQAIAALELDVRRRKQALAVSPSPEAETLLRKFQELLASRIRERDGARRDLAELESQPRWILEKKLTATAKPGSPTESESSQPPR
jgi:hypothetical protein